jgi:hypothetical protein
MTRLVAAPNDKPLFLLSTNGLGKNFVCPENLTKQNTQCVWQNEGLTYVKVDCTYVCYWPIKV